MKAILLSLGLIFSMQYAVAHEGHDQTPGMLKANHGGTVLAGKEINLEYIASGGEVKFYPASHDAKDLDLAKVKISGNAKAPKGKAEALTFESKDGAFVSKIDFKSAYRLELNISAESNGKKSSFKFQVEK